MLNFFRSNVSFSRQLSSTFVVGILVLALVSSLLISWLVTEAARNYFISAGQQMTQHFSAQSRLALLFGSAENAVQPLKSIRGFPDIDYASIIDQKGHTLLTDGDSKIRLEPDWQGLVNKQAELVFESREHWYFASLVLPDTSDESLSPFAEQEDSSSELLGYVMVAMGKDTLYAMTNRIFIVNAVISMTLASLLLVILQVITKRLTTPLENLCQIMRRAEHGETGIRIDLEGSKDIKEMEHSFNKMMDVLEEREAQLEGARDAALETARAKAEFAAVVSHEVRTPLNGVIGMLNLINEIGVPERQRDYLNVAISSGDTLLALINDILDFSKIEAGKLEIESIDFNLRECLEDVIGLFAETAHTRSLELCLQIPADLPVQVTGDVLRLRQVLTNLLSNALKFTEEGEVMLSIAWQDAGNGLLDIEFAVEDTGIGIPKDAQKKIFESFRQADGSTTRRFGGTGLGLTICKQLIELLGGELNLESAPGVGSRFFFNVQLKLLESCPDVVNPLRERFLVIDSNKHNRQYLASCLNTLGWQQVHAVADMKQLARTMTDNAPDVCLLSSNVCDEHLINQYIEGLHEITCGRLKHVILLSQPGVNPDDNWMVDHILNRPVRLAALNRCLKDLLMQDVKNAQKERRISSLNRKPLTNIRILIVDDNRTNQLVAKAMLSETGYQADVASNGEEAVQLVQKGNYDLVLMDCNMPVMDGYEATTTIRELSGPVSQTTIFAMTAVDNPNDIRRCHEVGMNDFLLKPLNLDSLRQKLENLFQGLLQVSLDEDDDAQSSREACIDNESLANLENAMGDKVGEIIEAFLADTPGYITDLEASCIAQDWPKMGAIAHSLKGSSRNLGANQFASVCREIEERITLGTLDALTADNLVSDLEEHYLQVESALRYKLGTLERVKRKKVRSDSDLVLIVDDDRSTRLTIANSLENDGLWLEHASNGQVAIEKFVQLKPDLIIMDAVMPVVDGFDASLEIKRLPGGRTTPILMITALENDESVERAFKCGAADFIPKPINLAVLRQRVKRVLDARQTEQRVKHLAYNDSLTGLPNRIAFSDRLHQDLAYAKRNGNQLAVMFLDVDHFKHVNDNLGHAAGDELLKALAQRVVNCIRSEDILARLGGDEFIVVLSSVHGPEGADIAAKNILKAMTEPFQILGKEIYIGASIGISIFPDDGQDRETLLKNADTAMYRAKSLGRNNYQFYTEEMSATIAERLDIENDLRKALKQDELRLYFQPKVDAATDKLLGAEALIRWQHPKRGLLFPDAFIPIAEDSGLIEKIGSWVLLTACKQFKLWTGINGFNGSVAVNVSARQFMEASFLGEVKQSLNESGLSPDQLELELTENTILEHVDETIQKFRVLRDMGVKIAIDDFGVGYSSFNYLKQMPVDVLKIDKSFIRDVPDDGSGAAIIDGIIRLGHNLNLAVVAEGVESEVQYKFLKYHDCDTIQGNFVSRPITAQDFFETYISAK